MTEDEQKKIFAQNLNKLIERSGKEQKAVAKELGIPSTTFNTWCVGKLVPPTSKLRILAEYFHVSISRLIDVVPDSSMDKYYIDEETVELAQQMKDNAKLRILFDAARDASPEDLQTTYQMLLALKKKERGNE